MALIDCKNISVAYDGKKIIEDLSFNVGKGQALCIVGENGSGKTTLVKAILSLIKLSGGEIKFGDGLKQNEIGYLPQQTELQKDFPASVSEIILSGCINKMGLRPFYTKKERTMAEKNAKLLGIENFKKRCYHELSGGQQQRVLLARALCAADRLLLLDEPVAGLDPMVTADLYSTIKKLNKENGMAIIMVSHDIPGALGIADNILHMNHGSHFFGSVQEYKGSPFFADIKGGNHNG